jgi:hypothetical protein
MHAVSGDVAVTPSGPRVITPVVQPQTSTAAATPDKSAEASASKRPLVNPSLHVDLALNLVVLEFVDDKGDVTNSIPSAKQLKAYQDQAEGPPVPGPARTAR